MKWEWTTYLVSIIYFFEIFILWPVAGDLSGVTEEVSENTNKSNGTDKAEILLW